MQSEAAIRKALPDRRTSQNRGSRVDHTLAALVVFIIPPVDKTSMREMFILVIGRIMTLLFLSVDTGVHHANRRSRGARVL